MKLCQFQRLTALVDESMSSIQGKLTPGFFHPEKFGKYQDGITGPLNTLLGLEAKVWKDMSASC
jgi:hypothetical protein